MRTAKPGISVKMYLAPIFHKRWDGGLPDIDVEAFPVRQSAWLPGGDTVWLTRRELADFEKSGGRASFSDAVIPDGQGKLITVEFDTPHVQQ